ncbi:DinB family protein [Tsukamurella pseudospumae]|uniref:Mini-circle protein n=1 Tax=Tsukamurella pseudospumae TaxID=239498 RepID=A0A137ZZ14_9ACTN|nr:DinB family protein [Tsukamurella pseudospumae]KXO97951.1 hypothetical protein AXK61_20495 [Tsukamurella pseudospumae]KXP03424.1 hypothetical protein AXK60_16490 [Tsukamurella pseudospumae]
MPFLAPPADTERAGLRGFLRQQLDALRHTTFGLTEAQIRASPARSTLTLGGLISHVAFVVDAWALRAECAPDRPAVDPEFDGDMTDKGFDLDTEDTLESLLAALDEASARILAVAEAADLDTVAPVPDAPYFPDDLHGWTVRWILLHVIEEVARHTGHADILREQVDGATAYELVAAAEDMGDLGFVRPWSPSSAQ